VQPTNPRFDIAVTNQQLVSHAGVGLLAELADRVGLTGALGRVAVAPGRARRHPIPRILRDLIVMLADGGDCLERPAAADRRRAAARRGSDPPRSRPHGEPSSCSPWTARTTLAKLRLARAVARASAWRAGAGPTGRLIVDLDATLVVAHTDRKQGASGTYKHTFGFHPMLAYLDHGDGRGEPLAAILRTGAAGANDAADHIALLDLALAQLPPTPASRRRRRPLVRTDSAGASAAFLAYLRTRRLRFSVGMAIDAHVRDAVLSLPERAWTPAIDRAGRPRAGAWVAEVTGWLDLSSYPTRTRAVCRRERPHPGAKPAFTDPQGRRYQVFLTNQPDTDLARLELRHRQHARVEDRIRAAKATGGVGLPFDRWRRNAVWLQLVLAAQDLTYWLQALLLDGELAVAEPKRLRTRLLHTAGHLVAHTGQQTLRLAGTWPWTPALATAFTRLRTRFPATLPRPG
jgi:hypothetical protein